MLFKKNESFDFKTILSAIFAVMAILFQAGIAFGIIEAFPLVGGLINVSTRFMLLMSKFFMIMGLLWIFFFLAPGRKTNILCIVLILWIIMHYLIGSPAVFSPITQENLEQLYGMNLDKYYNHK